jgi:hypothetical protein
MAFVKLPFPDIPSGDALDPEEVDANFRSIAAVVNGRLGVENIRRNADGIAAFEFNRSSISVYIGPMAIGGSGYSEAIFIAPVDATLVAVGVMGASYLESWFSGRLMKNGATLVAELEAPSDERDFWVEKIDDPVLPANATLTLVVDDGSADGLQLELRLDNYP